MTNDSITVIDDGKTFTVNKNAVNFNPLRAALLNEDWDKARDSLTIKKTVEAWANGMFRVVDGLIKHGDENLPDSLSDRIFDMIKKGDDPEPLLNFWERLAKNPSWRSVTQLWGFLANKGIPLDPEGCILAYKSVNADWTDVYSGKIANTVGSVHEMPRNQISDDADVACHFGYHVGAIGYAESFGPDNRKIIICKVDPMDVVCIPKDSGQQKMRTCRYEVIGVYSGSRMSSTTEDTRKDPAVAGKAAKKAGKAPKKDKVAAPAGKHPFDDFDSLQLMEQNLGELRNYAAVNLKIVGASKIPGGKSALVIRIGKVRD
jgi:hypothetical protein